MSVHEKILVLLLRFAGIVMLLAFFAVFLPVDWMAAGHRMLGLGEYPASALVDYLNRSVAALYALLGGLRLLIAEDVRRYRPIVAYVAVTDVVFGFLMLGIDLHAGMPLVWTLAEGPPVVAVGAVMLWLLRSVPSGSGNGRREETGR
jgi:hypothetical protein